MPVCTICSTSYTRAEHLRRHIDAAHAPISTETSLREKYRCSHEDCGRSFIRSDALLRHKRTHEQPRWQGRSRKAVKSPGEASIKSSSSQIVSVTDAADHRHSVWSTGTGKGRETVDQWAQQALPNEIHTQPITSQSLALLEQPLGERDHFYLAPDAYESVSSWQSRQNFLEEEQRNLQAYLSSSLDPNFDAMVNLGWASTSSIPDHYFTGLDWTFDDLTDVKIPPAVVSTASEGSEWHGLRPNIGDTYDNDDSFMEFKPSPDTTETLNLLNLANAALNMTTTNQSKNVTDPKTRYTRIRDSGGINTPQNEEDNESSWPQEFRPKRRKPPTIELSSFSLANEWDAAIPNKATSQDISILIDDVKEETPPVLFKWTINDEIRQRLLSYLTHSCRHSWSIYSFNPSPPASFLTVPQLQKLVDLFFAKFNPFVPVIHAATFNPATAPPVLLLIVVTIGLVFYSSEVTGTSSVNRMTSTSFLHLRKTTSTLAVAFSELVRIGVCSAYEADQRGFTDVSINQAWILQQTFGIASGDKRLNKIAERNRGGIVTAIRRLGLLYQTKESMSSEVEEDDSMDSATCQKKWHSWIANETRLRLGWFVYLYDQKFSCYLDVAPMFRYTEVISPMPGPAELWSAENADVWMQRRRKLRSESSSPRTLHGVLRQLLQPSPTFLRLQLNQLEAYILALTLYRIRWDASKDKILFDDGDPNTGMDAAAAMAMQRLADAAASQSIAIQGTPSSAMPLSSDVLLFHLLAKLHFTGPPLFFDKLRDAAGRSGTSSKRHQDAIMWLQDWMKNDPNSQTAMRRMLLASSQVYALERTSSKARVDKDGMQSNIRTMTLFHAALIVWAYTRFATEVSQVKGSNTAEILPRLSPGHITALCEKGVLILDDDADYQHEYGLGMLKKNSFTGMTSPSRHVDFVGAWIQGRYISTHDEKIYDWPLQPTAVSIGGIGTLKGQEDAELPSRASHILERFAMLLARIDWGLAASFRLILLHMARHAVK